MYDILSHINTPTVDPMVNRRLTVCVGRQGFTYSVVTAKGILLCFCEVAMDMGGSVSQLTERLKGFFDDQRISIFDFVGMTLVMPARHAVWIPDELFVEKQETAYLTSLVRPAVGMGVFSAHSDVTEAHCVFEVGSNVVTAFKIMMPGIDVVCQHNVLVSPLLARCSERAPVMLIHKSGNDYDFEVMRGGKMLLSNRYAYERREDLRHRAVEVMKTLEVESPDLQVLLCGDVERDDYASLLHFFPHVSLFDGADIRFLNPEFKSLRRYRSVLNFL